MRSRKFLEEVMIILISLSSTWYQFMAFLSYVLVPDQLVFNSKNHFGNDLRQLPRSNSIQKVKEEEEEEEVYLINQSDSVRNFLAPLLLLLKIWSILIGCLSPNAFRNQSSTLALLLFLIFHIFRRACISRENRLLIGRPAWKISHQ